MISLLAVWYLFSVFTPEKLRKPVLIILIAGLLTGNLWVYPDRIAKGWDSTLAYLPYFPLREQMIGFMKQENIQLSRTGTLFPNSGKLDYIDLSGSESSFAELDLDQNQYVFYSNIFNGFTDDELSELKKRWMPVRILKSGGVRVILFRKPGYPDDNK